MRAYGDFAVGSKDVNRFEDLLVDILNEGLDRLVQDFAVLGGDGTLVRGR